MKRSVLIAASALLCALSFAAFPEPAAARSYVAHPDCNIVFPCEGVGPTEFGRRAASSGFGTAIQRYTPRAAVERRGIAVGGLVAPLAAKLASIQAACPGTVAVSGVRHTKIAGTNRISLHASGKAVDVQGPYGCIYAQLRGWVGGYSTDAGRMRHIHISYDAEGGREMGLAFRHGGGRKYARHKAGHRHARHHRHRPHYATAHPR